MDEAVCDLIQRSRAQVTGMSYLELTHPRDRMLNRIGLKELREDGAPSLIRKRYVRPDGSFVAVDLEVSRLSAGSDMGSLIGTVRKASPGDGTSMPERLRARARHTVDLALRRNREFGNQLAGDHAWIILLQLYLAEAEGRNADLGVIGDLMCFPQAVIIRWAKALLSNGLMEEVGNFAVIQLTQNGFTAIERVLEGDVCM